MYDDEWMSNFSRKAGPRLKENFEQDLGELPPPLTQLLQRLRESEDAELALAA